MQHPALERKKSFKRISKKGSSSDYYNVGSRDDSDQLPTFFFNCVSFLEEHALDEEGILRIHGRSQDTTAINAYLASGDSNTTLSQVDPHAVATLLKSYLSQGPPLLPMEHYSTLIEIGGKQEPEGEELLSLRDIVASTPLSFQRVLHRVLIFIDNVQQHSSKNKMDTRALSVIFNPILLRAPTSVSPAQILSQTQSCIGCVNLLLKNYQSIFEGLGLNSTEAPMSPPVPTREGNLQGGSSVTKDKVKVRFLFNFSVKTGGSIQNTVSLFLKWTKQVTVKRRETGQTNALVCTNPQEVDWDEVIPLEVTLAYNKRLKIFEPRSLVITLKCATPKGSKTLGAASINLAELIPLSLQTSPREESKTYEMAYKGAKSKGLILQVKSHSEWRKVNNKLVVRQDTGSLSRKYGLALHEKIEEAGGDKNKTLRKASAAQKSMPNLNNLDAHRDEDDAKHPLSAREHYSESALNVSGLESSNDLLSSPASSPPVSPSLPPNPTIPNPITPRENQNTVTTTTSSTTTTTTTTNNNNNNNNNNNSNSNNSNNSNNNNNNNNNVNNSFLSVALADFSVINSPRLVSPRVVGTRALSPIQTSPRNHLSSLDVSPSVAVIGSVGSPVVSPVSSPLSSPLSSSISAPIPITASLNSATGSSSNLSLSPALSPSPSPRPVSASFAPSLSTSVPTDDEKSYTDTNNASAGNKEQQHKEERTTEIVNKEEPTVSLGGHINGEKHEESKEPAKDKDKDSDKEIDKHSDKENDHSKNKEDIRSNSDSSDYKNKNGNNTRPQIVLSSPEGHDSTHINKEKRLKASDITLTHLDGSPLRAVSPTMKDYDPYISDGESDNDFDGHNAYTNKLLEQIENLQQQRRQLELETFNLRKCLLHNEIYRPQTLGFSERGIASTAEQIIENLFRMNCFQEPHNFLPSFFESITISLQQESKNEVELLKILYWLSTTLGLLYLLGMSLKGIPDPAVLGVVALTQPINLDIESLDEYEKSNFNLLEFASGVQRTGLELYNRVLKIFIEEVDDEKIVLAFLGRPKEKEEKRNFVIKEKPELSVKTPEPALTPKLALKEVIQEIDESYSLIKEAKIFENFAWHLIMHKMFCLDHRLVSEIATQKKLFSTDAQTIKQATTEVEHVLSQKFPTQTISNPMKITTQYITLVTAEYSKLDSETFISNSFTHIKPSQILQILEVLRPDKDSRKPVPSSVLKVLQSMAKSEAPRISPSQWHLNDDLPSLSKSPSSSSSSSSPSSPSLDSPSQVSV